MFTKILGFGVILAVANAGLFNHYHSNTFTQNLIHHGQAHIITQRRDPAPIYEDPESTEPIAHNGVFNHYNNHETHGNSQYDFSYSVADPHTGDYKTHQERRNGDAVHGYYQLLQPDGIVRKVEYTADDHNGFNAVVRNFAPPVHASFVPTHGYHHH